MNKGWFGLCITIILGFATIVSVARLGKEHWLSRSVTQHELRLPGAASSHGARRLEYGNLPLSFEVNQGQTDSRVKFLARGSGFRLFLSLKYFSFCRQERKPWRRSPLNGG